MVLVNFSEFPLRKPTITFHYGRLFVYHSQSEHPQPEASLFASETVSTTTSSTGPSRSFRQRLGLWSNPSANQAVGCPPSAQSNHLTVRINAPSLPPSLWRGPRQWPQVVDLAHEFLEEEIFLAIGKIGGTTESITQARNFRSHFSSRLSCLFPPALDLHGNVLPIELRSIW